jgi:hypothetical protein
VTDHTGQGRHGGGSLWGWESGLERGGGCPEDREHEERCKVDGVQGGRYMSGHMVQGLSAAAPGDACFEAELVAGDNIGGCGQDVGLSQAAARNSASWTVTS